MNWFQGGRADPPPAAFGYVSPRNPPTQVQLDRQRNAAARRSLDLRAARRQIEEARAWDLEKRDRELRREREIRDAAAAKAAEIKRARAQAGPRWDEDPVDYRCRVEAEEKIRRLRAAGTPDAVDLALQRGGGPAPTRRSGGAGKSRAQLAEELRALLPPGFQAPAAPRARRSVRLRPAMAARWETRG